jgi:chemotaxis signal transduction protein
MNDDAINNAVNLSEAASTNRAARKVQLVSAGESQFGIFADDISAIVTWREPAPLPYAPKSVLGVVSIEGRMLTVLDLTRLQVNQARADDARRPSWSHLVGLRGDEQLALAVDTVGEKIELDDSDLNSQPGTVNALVLGVMHRNGAEIKLLNVSELFPAAIQGHERRRRRF